MPHYISDLVGTLMTYFRIGSLRLKNDSNVLAVRDATDANYLPVATSELTLEGATSGTTSLQAAAIATPVTYTLPDDDGSTGDVLSTNGSAVLSWASVPTSAGQVRKKTVSVAWNDSSPIAVLTPPANALIERVMIDVDTAFDAVAPTISVGIAGTTSKYMGAGDSLLDTVAVYEVAPMFEEDGTPDAIIVTFAPSTGGAAGLAHVSVEYAVPA